MKSSQDITFAVQGFCVGIAVGLHGQYFLISKLNAGLSGVMVGWLLYIVAFFLGAWRVIRRPHP
jgi:hypothetical protein